MPLHNMLIKPVSGNCNLRCKYCFYYDVAQNREVGSYGKMSDETLEVLVKKALEYADFSCSFAFQGGEPTLAGLDFYRKVTAFQKKYNKKNVEIQNSIQTNGILLNEEWAKFLHDQNYLVGLSLDGTKEVHDYMRVDSRGEGTFARVCEAAALLSRYRVRYNILCVVNHYVAERADAIYRFFRKCGFQYIQPIPCLDPLEGLPGQRSFSLTPEKFAYFLKIFFDLWYQDIKAGNMVVVRIFDNYLGILLGYRPEMCSMLGHCICQNVIEADGSVYPCDFYVLDEWRMGNIKEQNFEELYKCDKAREFIEQSKMVSQGCRECKWHFLCRGGCRRMRLPIDENQPVQNDMCTAYKEFFEYAYPRLDDIRRMVASKI